MSNKGISSAIVKRTKKVLKKKYNLKKDSHLQQLWIFLGLLLFAVILWIASKYTTINLKDGIEIFVAVTVGVVAYNQWLAARHEISIDKYYDRLDNANTRLEKLQDVDLVSLHVFAEMDKLEYVLMKYKIGFMPIDLVFRAIENFKSLCKYRPNFHACATQMIARAAYLDETNNLVIKILNDKENLPYPDLNKNHSERKEKEFALKFKI